jgi:hypothetical protein
MDIKHKRAEANLMGNLLLWKEKKTHQSRCIHMNNMIYYFRDKKFWKE